MILSDFLSHPLHGNRTYSPNSEDTGAPTAFCFEGLLCSPGWPQIPPPASASHMVELGTRLHADVIQNLYGFSSAFCSCKWCEVWVQHFSSSTAVPARSLKGCRHLLELQYLWEEDKAATELCLFISGFSIPF